MAAAASPKSRKETDVIGVTFSAIALKRIDQLAKHGAHGVTRTEVVRSLVDEGLRQAMRDGFISMK